MRGLLGTTTADSAYQADAAQRDKAFQEDIHLQRIPILKRTQATTAPDNCSYQDQAAAAT